MIEIKPTNTQQGQRSAWPVQVLCDVSPLIILLEVSVPYGDNVPKSTGLLRGQIEIVAGSTICPPQRFEKLGVVILLSLFT